MNRLLLVTMITFLTTNTLYAACGMDGSINERIKDCSKEERANLDNLVLVSRDHDSNEFYKDMKTGMIWGEVLAKKVNYSDAKNICAEFEGLGQTNWKLPSLSDFRSPALYGSLPHMQDFYWTSTPLPPGGSTPEPDSEVKYQLIVNGHYRNVTMIMLRNYTGVAVRCVL